MKGKHSLAKNGLSLSQAQSVSNLCNQTALEIERKLKSFSNFTKVIKLDKDTDLTQSVAVPVPSDIKEILLEKSKLHAVQAFLMENIKMKDHMLELARNEQFINPIEDERPNNPQYTYPETLSLVGEEYGWSQLTESEYQEYLEEEACASHIGQFFHRYGILDELRKELTSTELLQWKEINVGVKSPIILTPGHTPEDLMGIYATLSAEHRKHEQRVNYFKAKVKNIISDRNAEINSLNAIEETKSNSENEVMRTEFKNKVADFISRTKTLSNEFEQKKELFVKEISQLRIAIPERFKPTIDSFINTL
jgi:hypothetical protein